MSFDFTLSYFLYCENAVGFLAQPFNVISVFAYFAVALWFWLRAAMREAEFHQVMAVLAFLHGCSSLYWHVTETPLGLMFDIISALLLVAALATVMCHKILRMPVWASVFVVVFMLVSCVFLKDAGIPWLSQSGGAFLPPLFFLAIAGLISQTQDNNVAVYILTAAYTLFFAVFFRSIDLVICQHAPVGTHFLSHIFGAVALIYCLRALDQNEGISRGESASSGPDEESKSTRRATILDEDIFDI